MKLFPDTDQMLVMQTCICVFMRYLEVRDVIREPQLPLVLVNVGVKLSELRVMDR